MTRNEQELIGSLFRQMYQLLLSYALSSLKNESLAEEAVQEAFSIACQKSTALYTCPNPKGWVVKTLKNTVQNMKRSRAHTELFLQDYLTVQGMDGDLDAQLDPATAYGDVARTDDFRLLWEMAVEGRSHLEMAAKRGISVNACKKRVERAKKSLKKKIDMSLFE